MADLLLRYTQEEAESRKKRGVPTTGGADAEADNDNDNGTDSSKKKGLKSRKTSPRGKSTMPTKIDTLILLDRSLDLVRNHNTLHIYDTHDTHTTHTHTHTTHTHAHDTAHITAHGHRTNW